MLVILTDTHNYVAFLREISAARAKFPPRVGSRYMYTDLGFPV